MPMQPKTGLQGCKKKCRETKECTAIEYASKTFNEETDCCVLRKCPYPVPEPDLYVAEWHGGQYSYFGHERGIKLRNNNCII